MEKSVRFTPKKIGLLEENKGKIERRANVDITINKLDVKITGNDIDVLKTRNIINAIFEGFDLERSFKLLNDENQLKVVRLSDFTSSGRSVEKIKGRIIGRGGRTRELIEELAEVLVSVHGDNVSFIGKPGNIDIAKKAVEMLINGKPHGRVYRYMEESKTKNEEMI